MSAADAAEPRSRYYGVSEGGASVGETHSLRGRAPQRVRLPGLARLLRTTSTRLARLGGARQWESLEGELRIEARHEYSHVQLRVTLRKVFADWRRHGCIATGDLTIEPGEQLSRVVADVKVLVADQPAGDRGV